MSENEPTRQGTHERTDEQADGLTDKPLSMPNGQ